MSALSRIRNRHALLTLVRAARAQARKPGCWQPLAAPVYPADTDAMARAQSLLAGIAYRDGSTNPGTLPLAHARDVLRWATARIL